MGYTRNTGQLSYLITYDGSGNITVPASFTQTTVTSSMLKADSAGKLVAAVAGTDFVAPAGLSAYVPTTRTITINGTTFDLSADRSWSIVSGVSSFNTRTGAITLTDTDVTGALGYTPVTNARTLTINGTTYDLSANRSWTIVAGLSSFNTRTGDITLLDTDVTGALGYTPVTNARTITINGTTYDLSANRTWVVDTSSVTTRVLQKFTATASQTTFTITGGYTVGMVDVFLNGVKLDNATEFTASNGSTVVLSAAAAVNDVVEVYKYGGQFIANNTLRQTTAFTATAGQTTFTVSYSVGFVDVFYNGAKLAAAEFTATNGTSIVLGTACVVNDIVEVIAYNYTVGAFTGVGGSGTTNYIPKWTASGTLGNSLILDNGTGVGIGTTSFSEGTQPTGTISIIPNSSVSSGPLVQFAGNGRIRPASAGDRLSIDGNALFLNSTFNGNIIMATGGGNVGIGTSALLDAGLTVETNSNSFNALALRDSRAFSTIPEVALAFRVKYNTAGAYATPALLVAYKDNATDGNQSGSLAFFTNANSGPVERMRLNSDGSLVVQNSTNPIIRAKSNNQYVNAVVSASWDTGSGMEMAYNPNSAVGFIQNTYPVTSGQVYGDIHFRQSVGGSMVNRMTIKADGGQVLKPSNPAFRAYYSVNGSWNLAINETFIFNLTEYNIGSHFNTSNGRFTAPVAGVYQFNFYSIYYGPLTNGAISFRKNNGAFTSGYNIHYSTSATGWENIHYSTSVYLNAGDYVSIMNSGGSTQYHGDDWSSFSGYLVG
jgi:predicted heme/steroid binding protein